MFAAGCASASVGWTPYPSYNTAPATASVEVFNTKPDKPYVEIGKIEAGGFGKASLERAVAKAKSVGADAILILKEKDSEDIPGWKSTDCVAIKYK